MTPPDPREKALAALLEAEKGGRWGVSVDLRLAFRDHRETIIAALSPPVTAMGGEAESTLIALHRMVGEDFCFFPEEADEFIRGHYETLRDALRAQAQPALSETPETLHSPDSVQSALCVPAEPTVWVSYSGYTGDLGSITADKEEADLWRENGVQVMALYKSAQPVPAEVIEKVAEALNEAALWAETRLAVEGHPSPPLPAPPATDKEKGE